MKKGIFGVLIVSIFILMVNFIMYNNKIIYVNSVYNGNNNDTLAIMLESSFKSGEYDTSSDNVWPSSGYTFNSSLSKCENGSSITWDEAMKNIVVSGNVSDKCYVYFDKLGLDVQLNNYTFTWPKVSEASSYRVLSNNNELLTTTNTSAEIYEYYTVPDTYNIVVEALDAKGNVLLNSDIIPYKIEKTDVSITGDAINEFKLFSAPEPCVLINNNIKIFNGTYPYSKFPLSNNFQCNSCKINFFHMKELINYVGTDNVQYGGFGTPTLGLCLKKHVDFNDLFFKKSNICKTELLDNFVYYSYYTYNNFTISYEKNFKTICI